MPNDIRPLVLDEEEAYLLNHMFHIGMSAVFMDESEVVASMRIAANQIATAFNEQSFSAFQDKMNKFFNQYAKAGDTITRDGDDLPPGRLN